MKRSRTSNTSLDSMDQDNNPDDAPASEPAPPSKPAPEPVPETALEPAPEPAPKKQRGGTSGGDIQLQLGPLIELLNAKLRAVQSSTMGPTTTTTTITTTTTPKDIKGKGKAVAFVDQQAADGIADKLSTMKVLGYPPPTPTVVLAASLPPLGSDDTAPVGPGSDPLGSGPPGSDPPTTDAPPNSPASNNDELD